MKTIKIFIASSKELREERVMIAQLANSLNTIFDKNGIHIIAIEWENLDSSISKKHNHKQDDYNKALRECEICIVLYYSKLGEYTKIEFDTAFNEMKNGNNPKKLYVFFKDCDFISSELQSFRDGLETNYGHFHSRYSNTDELKADFLLQFISHYSQMGVLSSDVLKIAEGKLLVGGAVYADINNVSFASNNSNYQKLQRQKENIIEDIDVYKQLLANNKDRKKEIKLESKYAELNRISLEIENIESAILNTAIQMAELSSKESSERLKLARIYFLQGNYNSVSEILNIEEIQKEINNKKYRILQIEKASDFEKKSIKCNIDEIEMKVLAILATGYTKKKRKEICKLCNYIIEISSILNDDILITELMFYFRILRSWDETYQIISLCQRFSSKIQNIKCLITLFHQEGNAYLEGGNTLLAKEQYEKSYKISHSYVNQSTIEPYAYEHAQICSDLGSAYFNILDYYEATKYYIESLACFQRANKCYDYSCLFTKLNLAESYGRTANFKQALELIDSTTREIEDLGPNTMERCNRFTLNIRLINVKLYCLNYINYINHTLECNEIEMLIKEGDTICNKAKTYTGNKNHIIQFYALALSITSGFNESLFCNLLKNAENQITYYAFYGNEFIANRYSLHIGIYKLLHLYFKEELTNTHTLHFKEYYRIFSHSINKYPFLTQEQLIFLDYCFIQIIHNPNLLHDIGFNKIIDNIFNKKLDDKLKRLLSFKIKVCKWLQESFIYSQTAPSQELRSSLDYYFQNQIPIAEWGIFASIIAAAYHQYSYFISLDKALTIIEYSLSLHYDYNTLDTKAEILYKLGHKSEALNLATSVYNTDNNFYPQGNEYLYRELMNFESWRNIFQITN